MARTFSITSRIPGSEEVYVLSLMDSHLLEKTIVGFDFEVYQKNTNKKVKPKGRILSSTGGICSLCMTKIIGKPNETVHGDICNKCFDKLSKKFWRQKNYTFCEFCGKPCKNKNNNTFAHKSCISGYSTKLLGEDLSKIYSKHTRSVMAYKNYTSINFCIMDKALRERGEDAYTFKARCMNILREEVMKWIKYRERVTDGGS